jgi:hypothetical protein
MISLHPRVIEKRSWLREEDVIAAWNSRIALLRRDGAEAELYVAAGFDKNSRLLEMVAVKEDVDRWFIFHAAKITKKTKIELGLIGR